MDLSLNLDGTHVLITGGSGFIGSVRPKSQSPSFKLQMLTSPSPR